MPRSHRTRLLDTGRRRGDACAGAQCADKKGMAYARGVRSLDACGQTLVVRNERLLHTTTLIDLTLRGAAGPCASSHGSFETASIQGQCASCVLEYWDLSIFN